MLSQIKLTTTKNSIGIEKFRTVWKIHFERCMEDAKNKCVNPDSTRSHKTT